MAMKPDARLSLGAGVLVAGLIFAGRLVGAGRLRENDVYDAAFLGLVVGVLAWLGLLLVLRALGWPRILPPPE